MSVTAPALSDTQFDRLRRVIYERSGIHFQASKKYVLESRLGRRLAELGFQTFDQYLLLLTAGPYQRDEFQEMFNRITINETSFFRNEPQLRAFESRILPRLLEARRATRRLRIWSAACSSGEEPYTLAIIIHRSLGVRLGDWKIEILGTDISEKALAAARSAHYAPYSLRGVPAPVLNRYFKKTNGFYQIDPELQSMVRFERLNLKDGLAARRLGTFDVIFCRNVLIYFDDDMKAHCARLFHRQLAPDGTLLIGHSETLDQTKASFERMPWPEAFAYARKADHEKTETAHVA